MKDRKKFYPYIAIFSLFLMFLLIQHYFVYVYHDDYGYLSLSYSVNVPIIGTHFNLGDILNFLVLHYQNWGGRILCFFYEIFFTHLGIDIYRIFQSIVITTIFVLIYLTATKVSNIKNWKLALITVFCYGIFQISQLSTGIYWISASSAYIIPIVFLLGFAYLYYYKSRHQFTKNWIKYLFYSACGILLFLASFSQEQIGIAALSYIIVYTAVDFYQTRKINKLNLVMCLISIIGFAILMLAPGNQIRMGHPTSIDFYSLSLIEKINQNIKAIIKGIFGIESQYFTILILLTVGYCSYKNLKNKNHVILKVALLVNLCSLIMELFINGGYFGRTISVFGNNQLIQLLFSYLQLFQIIVLAITVFVYLWNRKEWNIFYLMIGAIVSQIAMLMAPYYAGRCAIIFNIICFVFIINVLSYVKKEEHFNLTYLMVPFVLITSLNMVTILKGYYSNSQINKNNDYILKETSKRIKKGEKISKIELQKLKNDQYSGEQPYFNGSDYIVYWMYEYYDLPTQTIIEYK